MSQINHFRTTYKNGDRHHMPHSKPKRKRNKKIETSINSNVNKIDIVSATLDIFDAIIEIIRFIFNYF